MRILSFSEMWPKLELDVPVEQRGRFTTFRFPRKDSDRGRDWAVGEVVQVYYKSRSPDRERLGIARIVGKRLTDIVGISDEVAQRDGFEGWDDMVKWLFKTYGADIIQKSMNKLTLEWIE